MGKALALKNVNFSANKLTTVTLIDPKPCTGITLNYNSYSLTGIGNTVTLVATLAPADTTDELSWSTSDASIATVNNGVVTEVGLGVVTITATCGTQSASCTITATNALTFTYQLGEAVTKGSGTRDFAELNPQTPKYGALFNTLVPTVKKVRKASSSTAPAANLYPILLGAKASTVTATVPSEIKLTVWFLNSTTPAEFSDSSAYAKVISGDSSAYDSNVPNGNRIMEVPDGADSAVFSLLKASADLTAEDVAPITIVAS